MVQLHERRRGGDRVIEEYLRELGDLLRAGPCRRARILAEVEEHLRDDGGDDAAIERFGSPAEVAARFNALDPSPPARLAATLVLGGALFVCAAVQGLDDYLPPAPWPSAAEAPASLRATFTAATVALLLAVVAALAAFGVPRAPTPGRSRARVSRPRRLRRTAGRERGPRAGYVPGSPSVAGTLALAVLAIVPAAAGLLLLASPGLLRPLSQRSVLSTPIPSSSSSTDSPCSTGTRSTGSAAIRRRAGAPCSVARGRRAPQSTPGGVCSSGVTTMGPSEVAKSQPSPPRDPERASRS